MRSPGDGTAIVGGDVAGLERLATPAFLVFTDAVEANARRAIELIGGPDRWRPHVKTVKARAVMELLLAQGVTRFKAATTLELLELCQAGAGDVLLAYHPVGPLAERVVEIAARHPATRISVLAETSELVKRWAGTGVDLFLDLDAGLRRTGIPLADAARVQATVEAAAAAHVRLRGLHLYAGDLHVPDPRARARALHAAYDRVAALAARLIADGTPLEEISTAGTPALRASLDYRGFDGLPLVQRHGAGTIVFGDRRSLAEDGIEDGFAAAAVVLSRVTSRTAAGEVVCDAGHKAVAADAGVPTCEVVHHPHWRPLAPNEEHLPIDVALDPAPDYGTLLRLLPTHVCPTTNLFDALVFVRGGRIAAFERLPARGHELLPSAARSRYDAA